MHAHDAADDGRLARLDAAGVALAGWSIAGEQTFVAAPAMSLCFDAGGCPPTVLGCDVVALTHGHADHAAGLLYYTAQRYRTRMGPGTVACPRETADAILRLARCAAELEGHTTPVHVVGLEPGHALDLGNGRRLRAFATHHTVASRGYVVEDDAADRPVLAYTGDTGWGPCFSREDVLAARVLVTECTYLRRGERRLAAEAMHVHLDHVRAIVERSSAEAIVLTHLPRRLPLDRARRVLRHALPAKHHERVTLLMEHAGANRATPARAVPERSEGAGRVS